VRDLSVVARLIAEPTRAAMLDALVAGRALAAGELARLAGVSPATASGHLAQLRAGGLVEVVASGRHRYYRLGGPAVAHAMEALAAISPDRPVRSLRQSRSAAALAAARTCYDHLAGRIGVALHDALMARGAFAAGYDLTPAGQSLLDGLGVWVPPSRRPFARPCLDYTERRPHLAGGLGAALCARLFDLGWVVQRAVGDRGLRVTPVGTRGFADVFGIDHDDVHGGDHPAVPAGVRHP